MKLFKRNTKIASRRPVTPRCSHPQALIVDPTEREVKELETMLAHCPNCSQWHPGQGPIMAVLRSRQDSQRSNPNNRTL